VYNQLKRKAFTVIILLCFIIQACKNNQAGEIPVSDFFKSPEKSSFKISPNGKFISYLKPYKEKQNLFIQSLDDDKETRVTSFEDFDVREYAWTYGNHIIFTQFLDNKKANNKKKNKAPGYVSPPDQFKMYVVDMGNMQIRALLTQEKAIIRTIQSKNRLHPDVITITTNKRDSLNADVYRMNILTGELSPYIINPGNITNWYPDQDGVIRLAKESDEVDESILFRTNESSPFKPVIINNFKNSVDPIAFSGTKNNFYALSNVGRDKSALVEINAEDGKEENVLFASANADITEFSYSKYKHLMESVSWEGGKRQTYFLSKDIENIYADLNEQLKGNAIRLIDRDSSEKNFIINAYADRDPGSYYLYNQETKKLSKIGDLNPSVKSEQLSEMTPVSFKASDGLLINGYLTLPQGKGSTNLPVVVIPHNGPFNGPGSHNGWGYSAEVQFLANRGYAVFQLNYRGTTGYGKAFRSAGFKQVGGKIQDDITDGVKWLIAQKTANPKKIAIMGTGFGGFSALYGIIHHPELYNCAVVQSGMLNFFSYIKDVPPYFKTRQQMMYEMIGNPATDASQLRTISPVFYPNQVKVPVIIFQGGLDPNANNVDLTNFVRALQQRKLVTYRLKEKERSFFSEKSRVEMYTDIEKFLDSNMRVKP